MSGPSDVRPAPPRTLVEDLGEVADDIREVFGTELGMFHARCFVVVYGWTGGTPYKGKRELRREAELLPRPRVSAEAGVRASLKSGGVVAEGSIRIDQISPRYTQADLDTMFLARGADEEVFIEVQHDTRDGRDAERLAYRPQGKPERRPEQFDYLLTCLKVKQDRQPDGTYPGQL